MDTPAEDPAPDRDPADVAFDVEALWALVEAEEDSAEDPLVGSVVGDVRLVRVVGAGGMGRVYEGIQQQPRRTVALKLQRPGRLDRESTKRFLRELELLGGLAHPALCRVYAAGFHTSGGERLPWFTMEFVPGALPVTRFAAERRMPLRRRVELFREVCEGVAVAHAAGIVHRDLKAGNILVGEDGQPKVIDFGVATSVGGDLHATPLTRTGHLVGTLATIAPELLDARRAGESPRSDVWALGAVLHELATGAPPIVVEETSIAAAIDAIRAHRPGLAARARSPLASELGGIVDRALARSPGARHADAGALSRDLAALLARHRADDPAWTDPEPFAADGDALPRRWMWTALGACGIVAVTLPWLAREPAPPDPPPSAAVSSEVSPEAGPSAPPPFADSPIVRADFRHSFRDVFDPEADRWLVESSGARKWREPFTPHCVYWGPEAPDTPATLVFRHDFPRPSRRIYLKATFSSFDGDALAGIVGRGACSLEYSRDGHDWRPIMNCLEPRVFGVTFFHDGLLPDEACGSTSLWLRVRLLATRCPAGDTYIAAQFLRTDDAAAGRIFELDVECEPAGDQLPSIAPRGDARGRRSGRGSGSLAAAGPPSTLLRRRGRRLPEKLS